MSAGISTYLADKLLGSVFNDAAYTPPTTVYGQVHVGDPGAAGTSNTSAVTGRQVSAWATAASGATALSDTPTFTATATETWEYVSWWDAPTGGNFLASSAATTNQGVISGNVVAVATAPFSLGPIAS